MTSDPVRASGDGNMWRLSVDQVMTGRRHTDEKSGEAGQGRHRRHSGLCLRSCQSRGEAPPGGLGPRGDEKIIAPSVRASRDRGLMDTSGN